MDSHFVRPEDAQRVVNVAGWSIQERYFKMTKKPKNAFKSHQLGWCKWRIGRCCIAAEFQALSLGWLALPVSLGRWQCG